VDIGIGLPAAVPCTDGATIVEWAETAADLGFSRIGVLDRIVVTRPRASTNVVRRVPTCASRSRGSTPIRSTTSIATSRTSMGWPAFSAIRPYTQHVAQADTVRDRAEEAGPGCARPARCAVRAVDRSPLLGRRPASCQAGVSRCCAATPPCPARWSVLTVVEGSLTALERRSTTGARRDRPTGRAERPWPSAAAGPPPPGCGRRAGWS
jgi:hypothetical protein